jgi:peptidoglycan biosynthesis protein MviN/MurJ (putative lipid II flippase)
MREARVRSAIYVICAAAGTVFLMGQRSWPMDDRIAGVICIGELSLVVMLVAANSVRSASLYALGEFLIPPMAQLCRSIFPLCALAFLSTSSTAIVYLGALTVAGETCRSFVLRAALRRSAVGLGDGTQRTPSVQSPWQAARPHLLNMSVLSLNPVIDRMFAAALGAGAVTTLDLAEKVFYVPMLAISSSVVLISAARWSQCHLEGRGFERDYRATVRRVIVLGSCLCGLLGLGVAFVALVIDHASKGASAVPVAEVTLLLLLALPGSAVATLSGRMLTAVRRTRVLPAFAILGVGANVCGDAVGAGLFGVRGIAAATAVSQTMIGGAFFIYCSSMLRRSKLAASDGDASPVSLPLGTQ